MLTGSFAFAVVTEANIEDAQTQDRVLDCITVASKELYSNDIKVPPRSELFLELGDDQLSCNYYFVDHIGKVLFWLEDLPTELLDIPPAASASHVGEYQLCQHCTTSHTSDRNGTGAAVLGTRRIFPDASRTPRTTIFSNDK